MEKKFCLECGKEIYGRRDKKYCGESCRVAHNNMLYRSKFISVNRINRILKRNFSILSSLVQKGQKSCSRADLLEGGFNFRYFTSIRDTGISEIRMCYDIGYSCSCKGPSYEEDLIEIIDDSPSFINFASGSIKEVL